MGQSLRLFSKCEDHSFNSIDMYYSFIQRGRETERVTERNDKIAVKRLMSTE